MATIKFSEPFMESLWNDHFLSTYRDDAGLHSNWSTSRGSMLIMDSSFDAEALAADSPYDTNNHTAYRINVTPSLKSDTLIWYRAQFSHFNPAPSYLIDNVTKNVVTFSSSVYLNPILSGTAGYLLVTTEDNDEHIREAFIGTIGLPGSGADIVIGNTSISTGTPYTVSEFKLTFPLIHIY